MARIMPIRPPDDLRKILKAQAAGKGYTTNQLILMILWEWVEKHLDIRQTG